MGVRAIGVCAIGVPLGKTMSSQDRLQDGPFPTTELKWKDFNAVFGLFCCKFHHISPERVILRDQNPTWVTTEICGAGLVLWMLAELHTFQTWE